MTRTWRIVAVTALAAAGVLGALGAGAFSSPSSHTKSYRDGYTYGAFILHSRDPLGSVRCLPSEIQLPKGDNAAQYIAGCDAGF